MAYGVTLRPNPVLEVSSPRLVKILATLGVLFQDFFDSRFS